MSYQQHEHSTSEPSGQPSAAEDRAVAGLPAGGAPAEGAGRDCPWGADLLRPGYTIVPNCLFLVYADLGMSEAELVLVLHLCTYRWDRKAPFPSIATLAARMGKTPRQIQHYVEQLRAKGLLQVVTRRGTDNRQLSNAYDLAPLLARLALQTAGAADRPSPAAPREPGPVKPATGEGVKRPAPEEPAVNNYPGSGSDPIPPTPDQHPAEEGRHGPGVRGEVGGDRPGPPDPGCAPSPLRDAISRIGVELGDDSAAASSARAERLLETSGLDERQFLDALEDARVRTCDRLRSLSARMPDGGPRGMPYLFAVLESALVASRHPHPSSPEAPAPPPSRTRPRSGRPAPARSIDRAGSGTTAAQGSGPASAGGAADDHRWQAVLASLRETLAPTVYARLAALPARVDGSGALLVEVADEFQRHWLVRMLGPRIEDALRALGHDRPQVHTSLAAA